MRKIISGLIVASLLSLNSLTAFAQTDVSGISKEDAEAALDRYSDIDDQAIFGEAVGYLSLLEMLEGFEDGTFRPDNTVNRAEALKMAMYTGFILNGEDVETALAPYQDVEPCFPDILDNDWYKAYVCYAVDEGWINGRQVEVDGETVMEFQGTAEVLFSEGLKLANATLGRSIEEDPDEWYKMMVMEAGDDMIIPITIRGFNQNLSRQELADLLTRILKDSAGSLSDYLGDREMYNVTYDSISTEQNRYAEYLEYLNFIENMVDVMMVAGDTPELSTFVTAVEAAGLEGLLSSPGNFTVFAPTNAAFEALPEGVLDALLLPENKDFLIEVLSHHVVEGQIASGDIMDGDVLTSLLGQDVLVTFADDLVIINEGTDDAFVESVDILADNGVIHTVDTVLIPELSQVVDVDFSNLTSGDYEMAISPSLAIAHTCEIALSVNGGTATDEWKALAEWGDPMPLMELFDGEQGIYSQVTTASGLPAGEASMISLMAPADTGEEAVCVSMLGMLVGTNDGIVVAEATPDEMGDYTTVVNVYDIGTEENSDLNSGYEGGQPDSAYTAEENMTNGTDTDPQELIAPHPQFTEMMDVFEMNVALGSFL